MQLVSDGESDGRSDGRSDGSERGREATWYDAPPILSTGKFLRSTTTWFRLRECFQDLERGDAAGMLRNSRLEHTALRAEGVDHEVVNLARLLQQRVRAQRRRVPLPTPTPAGQHKTRVRHKDQSQHKRSEAAQGCGTRVAEAWPLVHARHPRAARSHSQPSAGPQPSYAHSGRSPAP